MYLECVAPIFLPSPCGKHNSIINLSKYNFILRTCEENPFFFKNFVYYFHTEFCMVTSTSTAKVKFEGWKSCSYVMCC